MLIDATHPEETRVVVLRGNRVEEFDFESASRKQLRGNIYLAKVTRVEPSLQAAFVDYGGNRHGFLAFSEIHPDYYQIPVADRQALIEEESRAQRDAEDEDDRRSRNHRRRQRGAERPRDVMRSETIAAEGPTHEAAEIPPGEETARDTHEPVPGEQAAGEQAPITSPVSEQVADFVTEPVPHEVTPSAMVEAGEPGDEGAAEAPSPAADEGAAESGELEGEDENGDEAEEEVVESVGGESDAMEEMPERAPRYRRAYKIQEVIKRRQVMLVQVVKEERGTKGAALTTYLSLAGRYSVLMPNTARGGGISRKVTNAEDRRRMKEIAEELEVPEGMGVILRTAGANRTKTEIKRDFEYLLRMWETVRDLTLRSTAPTLVYEEGSLVKRAIRDLYHKDIDEIIVEGEGAYREARDFMRMLMPSHAKNVKLYKGTQPVFTRFGIEAQLDQMFQPTVQLKSGGYIVLNQTEALVAIDVNSGRATREHSIEETALKTNLEAAAEIARQLRLRDLAGLIVIDFIDMEEKRNNRAVERKLKEALKSDRARIQVGRISHFGLLEMSRQRIRASVLESSTEVCAHCGGSGHVRSVSSVALQLLRAIEEMLLKGATHNLIVRTRSDVALYVLNHKRAHLRALEERFRIAIAVNADESIAGHPPFVIDRGEQVMTIEQARALQAQPEEMLLVAEEEEGAEEFPTEEEAEESEAAGAEGGIAETVEEEAEGAGRERGEGRRRRRGRRGRGGRDRHGEAPREAQEFTHETVAEHTVTHEEDFEPLPEAGEGEQAFGGEESAQAREERGEGERRRRRRGRRGGRRNRRDRENGETAFGPEEGAEPEAAFAPQAPAFGPDEEPSYPARAAEVESAAPVPTPASVTPPVPPAEGELPASPRRRSTVREPAPIVGSDWSTDIPAPVPPAERVSETPSAPAEAVEEKKPEEGQPERPRRFGWWSRR
jgi:ribonuclease E